MSLYTNVFYVAIAITSIVTFLSRRSNDSEATLAPHTFHRFKYSYLTIFYLMMLSDWLQGPYVYALYSSYGFSQQDIAVLFVAGFGSSFIFGTFVGSLADQFGRKKWVMLFGVLYALSCMTKHFNNYWILMVGRLLGGIATSLLFSVPESWMVKEHNDRGFDPSLIGHTFSLAMFGNSVIAILAGMVAQRLSDMKELTVYNEEFDLMYGGYCTPFDLSLLVLILCTFLTSVLWRENSGGEEDSGLSVRAIRSGLGSIVADRKVLLAGAIQSLFEGSMYTFVFMWTPALTHDQDNKPPYGLIFATFMVASMGGSSWFGLVITKTAAHNLLPIPMLVGALSLLLSVLFSSNDMFVLVGFLSFEACVGVYFPTMGTVKSDVVPEEGRAAIYNLFRVPLNMIVLAVLLTNLSVNVALMCCVAMLSLAFVLSLQLRRLLTTVGTVKSMPAKRLETYDTSLSKTTNESLLRRQVDEDENV